MQPRLIGINWLQVHLKFKLRHETLFLTVNILDRFLAVQKVARQRLQVTVPLGAVTESSRF